MEYKDSYTTENGEAELEVRVKTRDDLPFTEGELSPTQILGFINRLGGVFVALAQTGRYEDMAEAMLGCGKVLAKLAFDAKKANKDLFDFRMPKDEPFGDWKAPE